MSPYGIPNINLVREIGEIRPVDLEKNFLVDEVDISGNRGFAFAERDPESFNSDDIKPSDVAATALVTEDGKYGTPHIDVRLYDGKLRSDLLGDFVIAAVNEASGEGEDAIVQTDDVEAKGLEVRVNSKVLDERNSALFANLGYTAFDEGNDTSLLVKGPVVVPLHPQEQGLEIAA